MSAPEPQFVKAARSLASETGESFGGLLERHRRSSLQSEYPTEHCLNSDYADSLSGDIDRLTPKERSHAEACSYCSVMLEEMAFGSASSHEFAQIVRAVAGSVDERKRLPDSHSVGVGHDKTTVCLVVKPRFFGRHQGGAVSRILAEHWLNRLDPEFASVAGSVTEKGDIPGSRCAQFLTVRDAVVYAVSASQLMSHRGEFTCHVGVSTASDVRRTMSHLGRLTEETPGGEEAVAGIVASVATWLASAADTHGILVTEGVASTLEELSASGSERWDVREVGTPPAPGSSIRLFGKRADFAKARRVTEGQSIFEVLRAAVL